MESKIKELLELSTKENKTVMEAWMLFIVATFVLIGVIFRKSILEFIKGKEDIPIDPPVVVEPEEPNPEPEKPTEPSPEEPDEETPEPEREVLNVVIEDSGEFDNTEKLRIFNKDDARYVFPEGEFFALGYTENDPLNHSDVQTAKHGVVRVQGRSNVVLEGNNTIIYNLEPAVPLYNPVTGEPYPNNGQHASQRKIFYILDSNHIKLKGLGGKSNNTIARELGRPKYSRRWEFEHLVDIRDSQYIILENMYGQGLWGDGIYVNNSSDIFVKNVLIDWNGRQGGAIIAGTNLYVERYRVKNSNRSGFDIEGNLGKDDCEDVVITYSLFNTHLVGFPMGGPGLVKNFLAINNELGATPIWSKGDGKERFRENIMYVRTKARDLGTFDYTNNILIDGIEQDGMWFNEKFIGQFDYCTNITIRNCKINTYGWRGESSEPFAMVQGITPISEYKVYDNDVKIGVIDRTEELIDYKDMEPDKYYMLVDQNLGESSDEVVKYFDEYHKSAIAKKGNREPLPEGKYAKAHNIHFPEDNVSEKEKVSIPFETNPYIEMQWDRLYTNGSGWRDEDYVDDGWKPDWYFN